MKGPSISKTVERIQKSTPDQRVALVVYWVSACLISYGDRRFIGKKWTGGEIQSTYLTLYILFVTLKWVRKLTPLRQDDTGDGD